MSSIRADMQLNAAPFLAGIARVQTSMRNLQAAAAGITGAFFAVRSTMAGLSAVFDGMKNALDMGGKFSDLSASTGASVSELVLLSKAFENNGLAADAVGPMIARFQKALAGLNEDGQSTTSVLEKLGINTLALSRMSVAAQFQELSRAFSAIEDPAERTKRAMELFGRSGAQMLALFRDPEAFTRAAAEVGTMGDALEDNATKFDSMSDALTTIGGKLDQFFVGLMSGTSGADALERAATIDFTPMGQAVGGVGSSLKGWLPSLDTIEKWATRTSPLFAQINGSIKGLMIPKMADSAAGNLDKRTKEAAETFDAKIRSVGSEDERGKVMEELSAAIESASEKLANLDSILAGIPQDERSKIADALQRQVAAYEQQRNVLAAITPEVMAANAAEAERAALLAKSEAAAAKLAAELDRTLQTRDADTEKRIINELPPEQAQQRVLDQISAPDKAAELVLSVTGLPDIEAAQSALEAAPDEKTVEMILRATGTEDIEAAKAKLAALQDGTADITITSEGVTAEIERLHAIGGEATDAEKARLMELIEAEKVLLGIKERQTQEDEKRAAQAGRISQLMGDLALDADKVLAEAAGDKAKVQEIETTRAANELQRRFESEGMDPTAAAELARAKAAADMANQAAGNVAPLQPQQGDAQRSIGLGGSAGLGPSIDVQKEIAKKQAEANKYLSDLVTLIKNRTPVKLAEVFD